MVSYFHDYDAIGWSVFADTAIFAARPNEKLQQATRFLNVRTFITFIVAIVENLSLEYVLTLRVLSNHRFSKFWLNPCRDCKAVFDIESGMETSDVSLSRHITSRLVSSSWILEALALLALSNLYAAAQLSL